MPQPDLTDVTILLDRSASMGPIRDATVESLNGFLLKQKALPGRCRLSLYQFDDRYEATYEGLDLADVPTLTREMFVPRGNTALLGALGLTVDAVGRRLAATPEADRPAKVVVVVVTDGEENYTPSTLWGKAYTRERVFDMVRRQEEVYSWLFVYLGANQDAIASATALGIRGDCSLNFAATAKGLSRSADALSAGISSYRACPAMMTPGEYVVANSGFFAGKTHADDETAPPAAGAK